MQGGLLTKVESLKLMLCARVTSNGVVDENEYIKLRRELMGLPQIAKQLPQFLHICRSLDDFWNFIKPKLKTYDERREFLSVEFVPLLKYLESETASSGDATITNSLEAISPEYIQDVWHKALERRSSDSEGAITLARTLLESVCKHILDSSDAVYDETTDLPKLYKLTAKQLNLSPSQHTEEVFKQILGGCQSVVEGLGSLRNKHSDAHGKSAKAVKPAPRHAELAVNLSGAMASFLLQTHIQVGK